MTTDEDVQTSRHEFHRHCVVVAKGRQSTKEADDWRRVYFGAPMTKSTGCEVILRWHDDHLPEYCGLIAVARYPAQGGGFMHLCEEHAKPHAKFTERIDDESAEALDAVARS